MTRVPAHWGKRQTTPKACPIGRTWCFRLTDVNKWGYGHCVHYKKSSMPVNIKTGTGPVTVLCSAPGKKGKS